MSSNHVEATTLVGDVYALEGEGYVMKTDYVVLRLDENLEFNGLIPPFNYDTVSVTDDVFEEDYELRAYLQSETLHIPVGEVDEYDVDTSYVINGEQVVTLGSVRFLHPELVGGERTNGQQVVEVYEFSVPFRVDEKNVRDPYLVNVDDVVEQFRENTVEEVRTYHLA